MLSVKTFAKKQKGTRTNPPSIVTTSRTSADFNEQGRRQDPLFMIDSRAQKHIAEQRATEPKTKKIVTEDLELATTLQKLIATVIVVKEKKAQHLLAAKTNASASNTNLAEAKRNFAWTIARRRDSTSQNKPSLAKAAYLVNDRKKKAVAARIRQKALKL